jgi:hypothetical protein
MWWIWPLAILFTVCGLTVLLGKFLGGIESEFPPPTEEEINAMNARLRRQGLDPKKHWRYGR